MVIKAISGSLANFQKHMAKFAFHCGGIENFEPGTSYSFGNSDKSVGTWVTFLFLAIWMVVLLLLSSQTLCCCCRLAKARGHRGLQLMYFAYLLGYLCYAFHHSIAPFVYTDHNTSWQLLFNKPIKSCDSFWGPATFFEATYLITFAHYCLVKVYFDFQRGHDAWIISRQTVIGLLYATFILIPVYADDKLRSLMILIDFCLFFLFTLYLGFRNWGWGHALFGATQLAGCVLVAVNHPGLYPSPKLNWGAYGHLIWLAGFLCYPFFCPGKAGVKTTNGEYESIEDNVVIAY